MSTAGLNRVLMDIEERLYKRGRVSVCRGGGRGSNPFLFTLMGIQVCLVEKKSLSPSEWGSDRQKW